MDTNQVSAWADKLIDLCTSVGSKIVLALLIFIIGKIVISKILKLTGKIKALEKVDRLLDTHNNAEIRTKLNGSVPQIKAQTREMWKVVWSLT